MYSYLSIGFDVASCESRCFHCSANSGIGVNRENLPLERLIEISERYLKHQGKLYEKIGLHIGDCPLNHPDITPFTEYALGIGAFAGLSVNGAEIRDYSDTLRELHNIGDDWLQLSFYGVDATHDKLAGRAGDFALLSDIAKKATALGYRLNIRYFVNKKNVNEMREFEERIDTLGNSEIKLNWDTWTLTGRGLSAERLRIDEADREKAIVPLPDKWLSEREIIASIEDGSITYEYFLPQIQMLSFVVTADSVENSNFYRRKRIPFAVDDDEALLAYLDKEKQRENGIYSRIPDLISEYGDKDNKKLHSAISYRQTIFERADVY